MMREDIIQERVHKLETYQAYADPYPARVTRTSTCKKFLAQFENNQLSEETLLGRVVAWRDQGKIIFGNLKDESGEVQIVLHEQKCAAYTILKETCATGDFLEVRGVPFTTERGANSMDVRDARIVVKALRPLPLTWYGLENEEVRLRKRYIDTLLNQDARDLFIKKNVFWRTIRETLHNAGFLEVEMPVLESVPGGAEAEPFVTNNNALDRDFYLRISLELPLKKALVGGFEKVFEIGRIFRNEGIDREHLQDYTQMECYWAYANYEDMMAFTEAMYKEVVKNVVGKMETSYQGNTINWGSAWEKVDYYEVFKKETEIDLSCTSENDLYAKAKKLHIDVPENARKGRLIDLIYKKTVRPTLIQPCFLIDPPIEVEPLAKRLEKDKNRVARFQIVAGGTELGKGFSELNDPLDQRMRFEEQMKLREGGDKEAQQLDESFLEALEYGMPPAAGFGVSERLFAVLMDKPIRETVFFPLMREE